MANNSFLQKLMGLSFHVEMIFRRLYWSNISQLFINKIGSKKRPLKKNKIKIKLENIKNHLIKIGLKKGDILIVHSSFSPFKNSNIYPSEVIKMLLDLIGKEGTLVMPVIRNHEKFSENANKSLNDLENKEFIYDVKKSPVWTGLLPFILMNKKESSTSLLPFNTITALGFHSKKMIKNELLEKYPTPNGINSPWKYCTDRNALVISLGVDLAHSLTIIHTAEDVKNDNWPVKNWYRKRKFKIINNGSIIKKTFKERKPYWGKYHYGERTLSRDLLNDNIMRSDSIDGLLIESLRAKNLFNYLNTKNDKGYPYFWL